MTVAKDQTAAPVMSPTSWAMLVTLSLLWGGSFLFVGIAVRELPPFTLVAARVILASLALHGLLLLRGEPLAGGLRLWAAFFGMGFLNNLVPFCLIVWGQTQIASGLAAILNATTPFFTVIFAHLMTRDEKITPQKLFGLVLGFGGVAAMMGPSALAGGTPWGQIAILGAAVSYGLAGLFGRRFKAMGVSPLHTAAGQVSASSLMLLPLALAVDKPWTLAMPSTDVLFAVAGLAFLSTAFAYVLFFRILAQAGATNVSLVTMLIPPSAVLMGALILHERLAPYHIAGLVLIALGLVVLDGRVVEALRRWHAA